MTTPNPLTGTLTLIALVAVVLRFGLTLHSLTRQRRELAALAATDPLTGLANHRTLHERLVEEVERAGRTGRPCRSWRWTSTTSRRSTTPSATPRATPRCRPSHACSSPSRGPTTSSAGWAARSSRSSFPAPTRTRRWPWPSAAASRCRAHGGRPADLLLGRRRVLPRRRPARAAPLRARRRGALRRQAGRARPGAPLRRQPGDAALARRAAGADPRRPGPRRRADDGLPAHRRAHDGPHRRLRGAHALPAHRPRAPARPVVRAGAPLRHGPRARGPRDRSGPRGARPPTRRVPLDQRQPQRAPLARGRGGAARRPQPLVIELTEDERFTTDRAFDLALESLRQRGARIAVDDAGAGYAGLQQLVRIKPEILKLDRSLIQGIQSDEAKIALLDALARFATTTGAAVCAEGIEELAELGVLGRFDVTYAQGYALGRPAARGPPSRADPRRGGGRAALGHARRRRRLRRPRGPVRRRADTLSRVTTYGELDEAMGLALRHANAEEIAVSRVHADERCVETLSEHTYAPSGKLFSYDDFPTTERVLTEQVLGQVVDGDAAADAREVALLRERASAPCSWCRSCSARRPSACSSSTAGGAAVDGEGDRPGARARPPARRGPPARRPTPLRPSAPALAAPPRPPDCEPPRTARRDRGAASVAFDRIPGEGVGGSRKVLTATPSPKRSARTAGRRAVPTPLHPRLPG